MCPRDGCGAAASRRQHFHNGRGASAPVGRRERPRAASRAGCPDAARSRPSTQPNSSSTAHKEERPSPSQQASQPEGGAEGGGGGRGRPDPPLSQALLSEWGQFRLRGPSEILRRQATAIGAIAGDGRSRGVPCCPRSASCARRGRSLARICTSLVGVVRSWRSRSSPQLSSSFSSDCWTSPSPLQYPALQRRLWFFFRRQASHQFGAPCSAPSLTAASCRMRGACPFALHHARRNRRQSCLSSRAETAITLREEC